MSAPPITLKASTGGTVSVRKLAHHVPAELHRPHPPPPAAAAAAAAAAADAAPAPARGPGARPGAWQAPLWDMSAPPGGEARCLMAHACWCLLAGEVADRTGGSCLVDGLVGGTWGCFTCAYMPLWALTRYRLRQRHGIEGSIAEDCLVAGCLPPCYLAQALNHLDIVEGVAPRSPLQAAAAVAQAPAPRVLGEALPQPQPGGVRVEVLAAAAHSGEAK